MKINKVTQKQMRELVGRITSEGTEITYSQFLNDNSGGGEIYNPFHREVLSAAPSEKFFGDVDDYLLPIVNQVFIEAVEMDNKIYNDLVTAIQTAYDQLKDIHDKQVRKEQEEFEADHYYLLDRESEGFLGVLDGFLVEIGTPGKFIKEAELQELGKYKFVVGYKKEAKVEGR